MKDKKPGEQPLNNGEVLGLRRVKKEGETTLYTVEGGKGEDRSQEDQKELVIGSPQWNRRLRGTRVPASSAHFEKDGREEKAHKNKKWGGSSQGRSHQQIQRSGWAKLLVVLLVSMLSAGAVLYFIGDHLLGKGREEGPKFVEVAKFADSQNEQTERIDENSRRLSEVGDRVEMLEEAPVLTAEDVARQAAISANNIVKQRVVAVEERLNNLDERLNQTIRSIPAMVRTDEIESEVGRLNDELFRVRDTADIAYTVSTKNTEVLEEHNDILKKQEARLSEAEAVIRDHTSRLAGLEHTERAQVLYGCASLGVQQENGAALSAVARREGKTTEQVCEYLRTNPF